MPRIPRKFSDAKIRRKARELLKKEDITMSKLGREVGYSFGSNLPSKTKAKIINTLKNTPSKSRRHPNLYEEIVSFLKERDQRAYKSFIFRPSPREIESRIKEELRKRRKIDTKKLSKEFGLTLAGVHSRIARVESELGRKVLLKEGKTVRGMRKYSRELVSEKLNNIERFVESGYSLNKAIEKAAKDKKERAWLYSGAFGTSSSDIFRHVLSEEEREVVLRIRKKADLPEYP